LISATANGSASKLAVGDLGLRTFDSDGAPNKALQMTAQKRVSQVISFFAA
jgi:hypothetical protein